ncbi:unnamed protein product [Symbiodinium sp. CCMP2592]|nr:unnamed protein product [Symbiodinium sp. CCMP2592]
MGSDQDGLPLLAFVETFCAGSTRELTRPLETAVFEGSLVVQWRLGGSIVMLPEPGNFEPFRPQLLRVRLFTQSSVDMDFALVSGLLGMIVWRPRRVTPTFRLLPAASSPELLQPDLLSF